MPAKALPSTPPATPSGSADATAPKPDLLAFIEEFRATHDLVELDGVGFAEGLKDLSPGRNVRL